LAGFDEGLHHRAFVEGDDQPREHVDVPVRTPPAAGEEHRQKFGEPGPQPAVVLGEPPSGLGMPDGVQGELGRRRCTWWYG
jgi:hypothetical protein